jgi:AcrR family transcriptional regulator
MKRQPTQERSQQRRDRILRVTGELLNEGDYAAINVAAIAARAETSVGSIYQYFPNKDAILHALAEAYLEDMYETMASVFRDVNTRSVEEQVERVMGWLTDYSESHPGIHHVLKSDWVSGDIKAAVDSMHVALKDAVSSTIATFAPNLSDERRKICAEVILSITDGLMPRMAVATGIEREQIADEMKRAMIVYLKDITR